jgi:hypothetical protein
VIPPEHSADFVAHREEVLALSQHPYDGKNPVVNMAEKPGPLMQATRQPLPAHPGQPQRYDYAYERVGPANVVLCTEPLTGWRTVDVCAPRTALDWAQQITHLLDDCDPEADKVPLVCDNRNTHTSASLYEAFAPTEARRLARRLEGHDPPKHGSWLHSAESARSVLTK